MATRSVVVLFSFALIAVWATPSSAQAQETTLPSGAASLIEQVLQVAHALKASPEATRAANDGTADDSGDADVSANDADGDEAANGGVIPYARTVVQLFGRGVPVAPLDDLPRAGTTLNVRPCHGGCIFRLRFGF